jgi:hypothetical protein
MIFSLRCDIRHVVGDISAFVVTTILSFTMVNTRRHAPSVPERSLLQLERDHVVGMSSKI